MQQLKQQLLGEAEKGFAVVYGELEILQNKSAQAIKEIKRSWLREFCKFWDFRW